MKRYEVISKYASFPPGQVLELSKRQADARAPFLKPLGNGLFEVVERTGFKSGEILGIAGEIAKAGRRHFLPLDGEPEAGNEVPAEIEPAEVEPTPDEEPVAPEAGDKLDKLVELFKGAAFDEASLLDDGKPKVSAVKRIAGFDVTADERDMAWELAQE